MNESLLAQAGTELFKGLGMFLIPLLIGFVLFIAVIAMRCWRKVDQGRALIRNGMGGTRVNFSGMFVFPIIHRVEIMDISVKRIIIDRSANNGLICKDNMRADIKVVFFVRVNKTAKDVEHVAQLIGCDRASNEKEIQALFDAKFSEALKTVGKRFEFVELYDERDTFRDEIIKIIGTNLNGFILDDASIDHLEQTPLDSLDPDNILDAEGIKKITDRTAAQAKLANQIQRDKERVIKQQDVETREAILELERQLAEAEAKQRREIETVQSREQAEAEKVRQEQRQRSEQARIAAEEEIEVAEQNKFRQVLVAERNKDRTDAVELERVERDRMLEVIERDRLTSLKGIERDKAVEIEKKNIQDVIKERVAVEKTVVIEQQKILDTEAFAGADREKQVAITLAEKDAQEVLVKVLKQAEADKEAAQLHADQLLYERVKAAEASKKSAELHAEEILIASEAEQEASTKQAAAKKSLAEGVAAESAAIGLGEAQVMIAKAEAAEKQGSIEAEVARLKAMAEAEGIDKKAAAMKLFNEAGQSHEEFKLRLDKEKQVDLAQINVHRDIAAEQASVVGEALRTAKIDIVGGDIAFFDKITGAISTGKSVDRMIGNSRALQDVKETFFNGDPDYFRSQFSNWIDQFGITSEDLKNLTVSALLGQMIGSAGDDDAAQLRGLRGAAERFGVAGTNAGEIIDAVTKK
ncbi:MAG: flotillin [Verrucomicrobiales bacterium]|jgi:flotillin